MQSWLRKLLPAVAAVFATALMVGTLSAQGVTTGASSGLITDQDGSPLSGATVEFTHQPTGFRTTAVTNVRGIFTLQGLEPGGPYTVRIRQIGYRPVTQERIFIALGQTFRLNTSLEVTAVEVEEIFVQADPTAAEFAPTRQGTRTTLSEEQLSNLPSLNRRITDLAKATPQVVSTDANNGQGISVVGQNNRFNTIQIDGSTVNDRFGLGATGTAGGQAQGKPIGFDAVKEFQVELAPYDVRQGNFTGALINAITKSGTNEWRGSAFGYFRNQNTAGEPLGCRGAPDPCGNEFKNAQFGGSLGGPIVRDKAHFFTNLEFQRASTPATGPFIGAPASIGGVQPDQANIDAMNAVLATYGMAPGSGSSVTNDNPLNNFTARADWSMGNNNRLVFRYSFNNAELDVFNRTTSTSNPTFRFENNAYQFTNKTHNPSFQWFSNFTNGSSNEFRLSYNRIRDERDPFVAEPQVTVDGFNNGADDFQLRTGSEQFSQGNRLGQDILELTDNFTFAPKGNHRITVGTRNEFYRVENLFAQSSFGVYSFDDLADFASGASADVARYTVSGSLGAPGETVEPAVFNSATVGLYAQDQWEVTPKFNVTFGLRVDIPIFFDQPEYAAQVVTDFGDPGVPSGKPLWNPRAGFNWDIDGLGNQQLRGGIGMFTGNPAYVWVSNAYSNNGTGLGILGCGPTNPNGLAPAFNPDAGNQTLTCVDAAGNPTVGIGDGSFLGEVDIIGDDTKYPQVLRANVAYDRRLPEDFILTLEGMYNKGVNDYFIVNRNVPTAQGTDQNGRTVYGTQNSTGRSDPAYFNSAVYGTGSAGVFDLGNTSNNQSFNVTGQLRKLVGSSLVLTGAYTYAQSKDVQSFTSSRATSNWRFGRVNSGDQFADETTLSSFDRTNKVTLTGTYLFPWRSLPTQVSVTYLGMSGTPYTYVSGGSSGRGDLNADGTNANDPMYVIRDASDPGVEWNDPADAVAYDTFIGSLDCLNKQRGTIMKRNSCRNPWQNFLNLNVRQALPAVGKNQLTLEIGFFNFLNLLNSDWGVTKSAGGGVFASQTIGRVTSSVDDGSGVFIPQFNYTGPTNDGTDPSTDTYVSNGQASNSWQLQFSLRYEYGGIGF